MNVLQIVLFLSLIWNFNDTIVQLENVGATSAQFAAKPRCVHQARTRLKLRRHPYSCSRSDCPASRGGVEIGDQQSDEALADASLGGVSPSPDSWRED
jgi:hypothetical protein